MGSEYRLTTLESLVSNVRNAIVGGPFGSNLVSKDYTVSGVPVIRGKNMGFARKVAGEFVFVSNEKAETLRANIARPNDLVFTQRGTLGQVALVPLEPWDSYVVSQSQMKATIDPVKADVNYLYYFFSSPQQINYLVSNSIQTGVPHTNLGQLKSHPISIPSLNTQKAIVHILGTLDDKIELNVQMNETLESMAQALFKSWFVDFDPVIDNALAAGNPIPDVFAERAERRKRGGVSFNGSENIHQSLFPNEFEFTEEMGWIPKGWGINSLDQIADYLNGLALQKFRPEEDEEEYLPVLKIAQLKSGEASHKEKASINIKEQYIINDGDVIFSWSGSLLVDIWCGGNAALNQHLFKVTSEGFPKWFYLNYTKFHLTEFQRIATDKAVTMGHIKRSHLKEAMCLVPSNDLLEFGTSINKPLVDEMINLRISNRTLSKLRDTLLPKLLSGELRIPDAEKLMKKAGV